MLGEKKRFYILAQQISGNRAFMYALACMYALCFKIGKCWAYKKAQLVVLGWDEVRFKVIYIFTRLYNYTFFIHPAFFTFVRYDKVLESKEVK